jgi:glutamate/tyrosine decarboxylase-like PLP-dependent enzyme
VNASATALELAADPLGMSADEMRRLGHLVVDRVIDHLESLDRLAPVEAGDGPELRAALGGPAPQRPGDTEESLELLADLALVQMQHVSHPRYLARVPGPASFAAILGDWMATGFNGIAASWGGGAGPTTVELVALGWLREALGLDDRAEGILLSGGSMASLVALATARRAVGHGTVYLTDQAHSCIPRALRTLGYAEDQIRVVPTDADLRLDVAALERLIAADPHATIVVATAGSTNTGTVDPLAAVADVAEQHGLWLHVDGAYGAPAALAGAPELADLHRADSLAVDPHKWLFQPYDAGVLYVRRPGALERAFALDAEYLTDVTSDDEPDLRDRTPELSRRSRAVKLWLTFRAYGVEGLRAAIAGGIALAEYAEDTIRTTPELRVVTPARHGVVTFAVDGATHAEHLAIGRALEAEGTAALTTTTLQGTSVMRLCTINPRATASDIDAVLEAIVLHYRG